MPDLEAAVGLRWGAASPREAAVSARWGGAPSIETAGSPFVPGAAPPGSTPTTSGGLSPALRIDARQHYAQAHALAVVDLRSGLPLAVESLSMALDDGSLLWTFQASGRGAALFATLTTGQQPATVEVQVNGQAWQFVVESVSRPRSFGNDAVTIGGRSIAALAGAPYAAEQHWISDAPTTAAQFASSAQANTGVAVDWRLDDWLIPEGALSYFGTPLALIQYIAQAVAGVVTAARDSVSVKVEARYPLLPAQWLCVAPDVQVHWLAVESETYERDDQPEYDSVLLSGQQGGAVGYVLLDGAAGVAQAPLTTDPLLTDSPALSQRGQAIIGGSGGKARVTRTLPVLTGAGEPGVLDRGALVRWVDEDSVWAGIVRSVRVEASVGASGVRVRQAVSVDRHDARVVAGAPQPLVFSGPIPDQTFDVGVADTKDLSGFWSGGVPPYRFSLRSGALPAGIALDAAAGSIAGSHGAAASEPVRLRAVDSVFQQADSNEFDVNVIAAPPPGPTPALLFRFNNVGGSVVNEGSFPTAKLSTSGSLSIGASVVRHGAGALNYSGLSTLATGGAPSADHANLLQMAPGQQMTLRYWVYNATISGSVRRHTFTLSHKLSFDGPQISVGTTSGGLMVVDVTDDIGDPFASLTAPASLAEGWVHVEITVDSNDVLRAFQNGQLLPGTITVPSGRGTENHSSLTIFGGGALPSGPGGLDDLELVIGTCLHTANFTPPGPL